MGDEDPYIRRARMLAETLHDGVLRHSGGGPFIKHPERVVSALHAAGVWGRDYYAAAWLHDVVEDVPDVTFATLRGCGMRPRTVELVAAMTQNPGEKKMDYMHRVMETDAWIIRVADRIDNVIDGARTRGRAFIKSYRKSTVFISIAARERDAGNPLTIWLTGLVRNIYGE